MSVLFVEFPDNFERSYKVYMEKLLGVQSPQIGVPVSGTDNSPRCIEEGGIGYLQFGEHTEKIEIGGINNQPFKLLRSLMEPLGKPKSVESIFEAIRENLRSKSKRGVFTVSTDRAQKLRVVKFAIKGLQRGKKLRGKLLPRFNDTETNVWLEYNA